MLAQPTRQFTNIPVLAKTSLSMGNKASKKKREKENKDKGKGGKDKGKGKGSSSTSAKPTTTTTSTTTNTPAPTVKTSTPSSTPKEPKTEAKPKSSSSQSEPADNGTVADILCEDAQKEAAARGQNKVSKDDFDIIAVIGRGSFGKVCTDSFVNMSNVAGDAS